MPAGRFAAPPPPPAWQLGPGDVAPAGVPVVGPAPPPWGDVPPVGGVAAPHEPLAGPAAADAWADYRGHAGALVPAGGFVRRGVRARHACRLRA
eukprot:10753378-Alexandrium_andersonii.AAC.1